MANEYIKKMIHDPNYLNFVEGHVNTGDTSKVWWEDDVWLSNPNNFNLDISNETDPYDELTPEEKELVKIFPLQAYIISINVEPSFLIAAEKMGASGGLNDKKDAFRHAFFNALNARDVPGKFAIPGTQIVTLFSTAHESQTPTQLQLEKQMDIHNNMIGIAHCISCNPFLVTNNEITDAILVKLNNGELLYLNPVLSELDDPDFLGTNGINSKQTAKNGITISTLLKATNL